MKPENLFFDTSGLDKDHAQRLTEEALTGSDDGELFMEHTLSESFSFDNNRLRAANFDTSRGFGLRAVKDETAGYAHSTDLSETAIKRAASALTPVISGHSGTVSDAPVKTDTSLYTDTNPLEGEGFAD
ncbi:MAG: DNA gyrase modulator, partial [Pseudomonadota bacterium]|nr:DNA gyrase modulator [Pseudomonadota bacterium]